MLAIVDKALSDAKLARADVHEVLLVGGSTRVLRVQHLLQDVFSGSKFIKSINPDEAAARGAALLAFDMINKQSLKILEVAPISLHLSTPGGVVKTLIERNMKIPTKKTVIPITSFSNQEDILLRMYGSKQASTNDDNLVGEFHLLGIPFSSCKCPRIEVTYAIDENGILNALATNKSTWRQENVQIEEVGRLSKEELEQMINESG
ncbi:Heat shock 70 kDa protein 1, partial [Taenia solium]